MNGTSFPKAPYNLSEKLIHVLYEFKMYLYCRENINDRANGFLNNMGIEACFLHARNLYYFFKSNQTDRYKQNDIYCQDYGYVRMEPDFIENRKKVGKVIEEVHRRVMHLTADREDNVNWQFSALQSIDQFIIPLIKAFILHVKTSKCFIINECDMNEILKLLKSDSSVNILCGVTQTTSDMGNMMSSLVTKQSE